MKRFIMTILLLALLCGCSEPRSMKLPTDTAEWKDNTDLKTAIKKLSDEEKKLLMGYSARAILSESFNGGGIKEGMTIGEAIDNQKEFLVKHKAKTEAKAKAKAEAETEALVRGTGFASGQGGSSSSSSSSSSSLGVLPPSDLGTNDQDSPVWEILL